MPVNEISKDNNSYTTEFDNFQKDYDTKLNILFDQKSKAEWRLGEMTQNWHDAKWRYEYIHF